MADELEPRSPALEGELIEPGEDRGPGPEAPTVARAEWAKVLEWLDHRWHPGEHVSIFGRTGSGKTYVIVNGLMPLWTRSRGLIIDVKRDRGTMAETGHIVSGPPGPGDALPFRVRDWTRGKDAKSWDHDPEWYKLQPPDYKWDADRRKRDAGLAAVQARIGRALQKCFDQGDWVIVLDEVQTLSDPRAPGLDLTPILTRIWREGRDRRVTVIAGTQAPTKVPTAMYDQCTYLVLGRMRDARRQLRLGEIAGDRDLIEATLPQLQHHELLLGDLEYDDWVISKVA